MPKKSIAPTPSAAALITAKAGPRATAVPEPSAAALAELRALIAHNDASGPSARVGGQQAVTMLRAMGWAGRSRPALDYLCAFKFGRRSYATP